MNDRYNEGVQVGVFIGLALMAVAILVIVAILGVC